MRAGGGANKGRAGILQQVMHTVNNLSAGARIQLFSRVKPETHRKAPLSPGLSPPVDNFWG
jgi:hypothetical protein